MTATRTITMTVPATWYVAPDADGVDHVWQYMPERTLGDEPVADRELSETLSAALPRMRWGYLSDDELHPALSEAQARVRAWLRRHDDPDAFVVHRVGDIGDWVDDCGLTYQVPAGLIRWIGFDLMQAPDAASYWIHRARQMVEAGEPNAADHYAALVREARAHGNLVEG